MDKDKAIVVSNKMIDNARKELESSVKREDWRRAADLELYISGMQQILMVFEQERMYLQSDLRMT